jgi:late competence protein required for DNA uptake (superfamily II DNA/RNA helicase)
LWLAEKMSKEGLPVALLTGDLTVEQRAAVIKRFRAGTEKVLITTNVSARGLIYAVVYTMYIPRVFPRCPFIHVHCMSQLLLLKI